jgi:hypothetical protein
VAARGCLGGGGVVARCGGRGWVAVLGGVGFVFGRSESRDGKKGVHGAVRN